MMLLIAPEVLYFIKKSVKALTIYGYRYNMVAYNYRTTTVHK
jgi:hypothetical protein